MTTATAARLYEAQHLAEMEGRGYVVFNPHNKPLSDLPVIYGFNNGGYPGLYQATLIAADGTALGGHGCSTEGYMLHDLGILEGTRPDRHERFREHYPDGYRMDFVSYADAKDHPGLKRAFELNRAAQGIEAATAGETTEIGSTEGKSPVRDSECAQTPTNRSKP
jgi:hypothetical protein